MSESSDPIRVLHVDDEPDFADMATTFLERTDDRLQGVTETDPNEALSILDGSAVDCVVSDYDMPSMNGLDFFERVSERDPDLPFVLFTGKGSEEIASEAITAGVTDYLQKGGGVEQYVVLANRVTNAVEQYRTRQALEGRRRRLETLISNLPGLVYRCANAPCWPMEFVDGECESLTGYPASAIEDDAVTWGEEIIHPEDRDTVWEAVQEALGDREPFELSYRIVTKSGEEKLVWERGRGIYADDGDLEALEGFITDFNAATHRGEPISPE